MNKANIPVKRLSIPKKESRLKSTEFLKSEDLLQGEKEVVIVHGEVEYKLRKTGQDKLILTK